MDQCGCFGKLDGVQTYPSDSRDIPASQCRAPFGRCLRSPEVAAYPPDKKGVDPVAEGVNGALPVPLEIDARSVFGWVVQSQPRRSSPTKLWKSPYITVGIPP